MQLKQALLHVAKAVVSAVFVRPRLYFPRKTVKKMAQMGLSENDIQDVFRHGEEGIGKDGSLFFVRKYHADVIGFYFIRSSETGDYVVRGVWKHPR